MILLPDITIGNAKLSIQDPFMLNDYIITEIDTEYSGLDPMNETRIKIRNEADYIVVVPANHLYNLFRRKMNEFLSYFGRYIQVEGRHDIYDWSRYDYNKYILEIQEQCNRIRNNNGYMGNNHYLEVLKRDARRQGRTLHEPDRRRNDWYNEWNSTVNPSPSLLHDWYAANMTSLRDYTVDWRLANDSPNTEDSNSPKKYVHKNNYTPEFVHYCMSDEDETTTLLLGAEIEVDGGGESEEHAKKVLEIVCGVNPDNPDEALENKMYCMRDGSLTSGLEFATMPCSLEYHKKEMKYRQMFRYLDNNGYKAHDTTTCGLHIHANRSYLGKTELIQQLTISKILYILEKFNDDICVIARRSHYSKFVGSGKDETSVVELYNKYANKDKYVALNLKHSETIEFRCFKGTLKYETYLLTLEFVKNIIDYAKSINIEEIELIHWDDLMNTFSNELKEYYKERLEKETKKKEEEQKSEADTFYDRFVEARSVAMSSAVNLSSNLLEPYSLRLNSNSNNIFSYRQENGDILRYMFQHSLLGRAATDCSCNVSIDLSTNEVRLVERSVLDELKHKEKSLKKQIKYCNNFMEKKRLEIELKEVQKEIKKEKRRTRAQCN